MYKVAYQPARDVLNPQQDNSKFVKDPFQLKDPFSNSDPITPNDKQQYCAICNGKISNTFQSGIEECPNCGTPNCPTYEGGIPAHAPSPVNPNKGPTPTFIGKGVVNASYNAKEASRKNIHDDAKEDIYTVEFNNCMMGGGVDEERKKRLSVDDRKDEVFKSCLDLEIDG